VHCNSVFWMIEYMATKSMQALNAEIKL